MATEEVVNNATELLEQVYPYVLDKISPLVTIFKVVGIALLVYIVFLIVKAVLNIRQRNRIKRIEKTVIGIEEKLNLLLRKNKKEKKKKK